MANITDSLDSLQIDEKKKKLFTSTLSGDTDSTEVQAPEIGSHELVFQEKLGSGCFGTVYKGLCRGKQVAIKKLLAQDLDQNVLDEFRKEVQIMTHLRHPNIVLFMGACTEPSHLAIVTELMPRGNLFDILHSNIEISLIQKVKWAKDIAQGMNWLHCSKPPIIHRDLKPTNLLVDENWTVKLCDFGLSAVKRSESLQDNGVAPGTPLWMSPEVLRGKPLNEKSDVYSFAIVLWEVMTRKEPFETHDSYNNFVRAVCDKRERPPIPADVPAPIKKLMEAAWNEDPSARPSFDQIINYLDEAMIECALDNDMDAQGLWSNNFKGKDTVDFAKFAKALYATLKLPPPGPKDLQFRLLSALCALSNKRDDRQVATLERFSLFTKWFGPLKGAKKNILDTMQTVCENPWFHGDIERPGSETLLEPQKPGTYLVRVSLTEPEKTPFTISKVGKDGKISHQRINIMKDRSGYYVYLKSSKGQKKIEAQGGLDVLINTAPKELYLKKPCPGSKFTSYFKTVREKTGYDQAPEDDDE
eukprot:TRINITY_DN4633_c1_g1_i1.p1 TRINITY_DN4633_c1_g1~~TRINITY_DN4633_c1_g1_i1.p1  ORF type:complete len:529 (-),score=229.48 TRINITY_DN4633_c1_g1_i1:181-1767(-)